MKTPDQKKERDALIEALRVQDSCINDIDGLEDKFISKHKRTSTDFLWNIAQSYADHFAEIQALKSGEWVLVPKAILEVNDIPDDFRKVLEDNLFDLLA